MRIIYAIVCVSRPCVILLLLAAAQGAYAASPRDRAQSWIDSILALPAPAAGAARAPRLQLLRQDFERLETNASILKRTLD